MLVGGGGLVAVFGFVKLVLLGCDGFFGPNQFHQTIVQVSQLLQQSQERDLVRAYDHYLDVRMIGRFILAVKKKPRVCSHDE